MSQIYIRTPLDFNVGKNHWIDFDTKEKQYVEPNILLKDSSSIHLINEGPEVLALENELHAFVAEKFEDFLKAFIFFDTKKNCSVKIKDFRKVIEMFFGHISDIVFEAIMNKISKNPDGTINYSNFLSKFSLKTSPTNNGLTNISRRQSSCRLAISNIPATASVKEIKYVIQEKIKQDVQGILKQFYIYDYNLDGKIRWNNFRKILDKYCCRLTDRQFDKLCQSETSFYGGDFDYNCFLKHLGIKLDSSNSCSSSLDASPWNSFKQTNIPPANQHIEKLDYLEQYLRNMIRSNPHKIRKSFMSYDPYLKGYISMCKFKEILENCSFPMSNQLFDLLMERLGINTRDKIAWQIFLNEFMAERLKPSPPNFKEILNNPRAIIPLKCTTSDIDIKSIFYHMRRNLLYKYNTLEKTFTELDTHNRGWLTRQDIRFVMKDLIKNINDNEINEVVLKMDKDHTNFITLEKFIAAFDENVLEESDTSLPQSSMVKRPHEAEDTAILGKQPVSQRSLKNAEEIIRKFVSANKDNLHAAFKETDYGSIKAISKQDFQSVFQKSGIDLDPATFTTIWPLIPLNKYENVMYQDFLTTFSNPPVASKVMPDDDFFNFSTKSSGAPAANLQASLLPNVENKNKDTFWTNAEEILKTILNEHQAKFLSKIDAECGSRNQVNLKSLKQVLDTMIFPLSDHHFKSLFRKYGISQNNGMVDANEFLKKLSLTDLPSAVNKKVTESGDAPSVVTAKQLPLVLIEKSQQRSQKILKMFQSFSKNNKEVLKMDILQNLLECFNIHLNSEELKKVWLRCDPTSKGFITYEDFLKGCELEESYRQGEAGSDNIVWKTIHSKPVVGFSVAPASGRDPATKAQNFRELLSNCPQDLWKELLDLNKEGKIAIHLLDLVKLLEKYNISLTNDQEEQIMNTHCCDQQGNVDIRSLISIITYGETKLTKNIASPDVGALTYKDMHDVIRKIVLAHKKDLLVAFQKSDYGLLNCVNKDDFIYIFKTFGLNWDNETFTKFWKILPLNAFENLMYKDFVDQYCPMAKRPSTGGRSLNSVNINYLLEPWKPSGMSHCRNAKELMLKDKPFEIGPTRYFRREPRPSTALSEKTNYPIDRPPTRGTLVNAELAERSVKEIIFHNWKSILKRCQAMDKNSTGFITPSKLKEILLNYGKQIENDEFNTLATKFDMQGNDTMAYREMIRYFILDLKPSKPVLPHRKVLDDSNMDKFAPGPLVEGLSNAMLRIYPCVAKHWKTMRRNFLKVDAQKTGFIDTTSFRHILRNYNINLTEDEFYSIVTYYDKDFHGNIDYNIFLKAFLKQF